MSGQLGALVTIAGFLVLLAAIVAVRAREKLEINNSDILLALILVALWLFLTGRITKVTFGELGFETALQTPIISQVQSRLPIESLRVDPKSTVQKIPQFIQRKSDAIGYTLGEKDYTPSSLKTYLEKLTLAPYLRFLVFNNNDGTFFGIADARAIWALLQAPGGPFSAEDLVNWVKQSNTAQLMTLPGYVSSADALTVDSSTGSALEAMDKLNKQTLPVIDRQRKFVGVVDRAELIQRVLVSIFKASGRK